MELPIEEASEDNVISGILKECSSIASFDVGNMMM